MEEQYIEYILKQYFNDINYSVKDGNSGMNNTTKFLVINEEEYVYQPCYELEKSYPTCP